MNKIELMFLLPDVLSQTQNAYSRDRYGEKSWQEISIWLLKLGWSVQDTTEILNSKMTRWAHDAFGKRWGHFPLKYFKMYYAGNADYAYTMITKECSRTCSLNLDMIHKQMSDLQLKEKIKKDKERKNNECFN